MARAVDDRELTRPTNAAAGMEEGRAWVAFDLPLSRPFQLADQDLEIRIYDPIYFYAYTIMEPVLFDDAPAGCSAEVLRFDKDEATADLRQKLAAMSCDEMPSDPNIGALVAETVALTCS